MEFQVGQYIDGQYRVLARRSGAMGMVYIVHEPVTDKCLAVKSPLPGRAADARLQERFRRESRAWVNLGHHPHIVQAYLYREVEGVPFLFLEYVPSVELADVLAPGRPLYVPLAAEWALQIAAAMDFVHTVPLGSNRVGILHRDLKPANILVGRDAALKITDFGLSRLGVDGDSSATVGFVGTPLYASPEQLDGVDVDSRSDVYAFGAVVYELLTGAPPFRGQSYEEIRRAVRETDAAPVRARNPEVPGAFAHLVDACLARTRDARPESFAVIAKLLAECREPAPSVVPPPFARCEHCGIVLPDAAVSCPLKRIVVLDGSSAAAQPAHDRGSVWASAPAGGVAREVAEARIVVNRFRVLPRCLRVGDRVQVDIVLGNDGARDVTDAEVALGLPDSRAFRRIGEAAAWRGGIQGNCPEGAASVSYAFTSLEGGTFPPTRIELCWSDPTGVRRQLLCGTIPPLRVSSASAVPLIGRDDALRVTRELLQATAHGRSALLVLRGAAGTGKTFFLEHALRIAEEMGFRVASGTTLAASVEPLQAFLDMIRSHLGIGEAVLSEEEVRSIVARFFQEADGERESTAQFVAEALLGRGEWGGPRGVALGADERLAPLMPHRWYRVLLRMAATAPVLLVLENVHAGDVRTVELLEYLARRCREHGVRVLLCATCAPPGGGAREFESETDRALAALRDSREEGASLFHGIDLAPFGAKEVGQVVEALFPAGRLSERVPWLVGEVLRATGGNPRFVVELVRDLARPATDARFAISASDTSWELGEGVTPQWLRHHVPAGVEALFGERMRRMQGPDLRILEHAALIGEEFEVAILKEILTDVPEARVEDGLDTLDAEGFVRPVDRGFARYRFTHALFQAAIERELAVQNRLRVRRVHRSIAAALRRLYTGPALVARLLSIAEHEVAGGDCAMGVRSYVESIAQLQTHDRFYECLHPLAHAKEAAESVSDLEEDVRLRLLWLEAETYRGLAQPMRALPLYRAYVDGLERRGPTERLCQAWIKIGEVLFRLGNASEARESFIRARAQAEASGDRASLASAYNCLGLMHRVDAEFDAACRDFTAAAEIYDALGDHAGSATVRINLANVFRHQGRRDECRAALEVAATSARATGASHLEAGALLSLANLLLVERRMTEAEEQYRRALQLHRLMGARQSEAIALRNLGKVLTEQGSVEAARECYGESLRIRRLLGDHAGAADVFLELADLLFFLDRRDQVRIEADKALGLAAATGNARTEVAARIVLGRLVRAVDATGAAGHLRTALELASSLHDDTLYYQALAEIVTSSFPEGVLLAAADTARAWVAEGCAWAAGARDKELCARLHAAHAFQEASEGHGEEARAAAERACATLAGEWGKGFRSDQTFLMLQAAARTLGDAGLEARVETLARELTTAATRAAARCGFWVRTA